MIAFNENFLGFKRLKLKLQTRLKLQTFKLSKGAAAALNDLIFHFLNAFPAQCYHLRFDDVYVIGIGDQ